MLVWVLWKIWKEKLENFGAKKGTLELVDTWPEHAILVFSLFFIRDVLSPFFFYIFMLLSLMQLPKLLEKKFVFRIQKFFLYLFYDWTRLYICDDSLEWMDLLVWLGSRLVATVFFCEAVYSLDSFIYLLSLQDPAQVVKG